LFSSLKKQGVEEAEKIIGKWLFAEEPEDLVRKSFNLS
jgi:GTP-binding protein